MSSNKLEAEEEQEKLTQELIKKMDTKSFTAHKITVDEAIRQYRTDLKKGLSSAEAEKRLKEHGPNELDAEEEKSLWERIIEQFEDILVRILLASATVSFVIALTGDGEEGLTAYVEPFVILLILVLNAIVAIWQDSNADNALEALKEMQAQECLTLRDGEWGIVDAKELVPGDVVKITMGQCVPADLRCVDILSIALKLEQAALTGESQSVSKNIN
jgi:Ca2+-transporting ATPase